jgi:hypothetical protein
VVNLQKIARYVSLYAAPINEASQRFVFRQRGFTRIFKDKAMANPRDTSRSEISNSGRIAHGHNLTGRGEADGNSRLNLMSRDVQAG